MQKLPQAAAAQLCNFFVQELLPRSFWEAKAPQVPHSPFTGLSSRRDGATWVY